MTTNPQEIKNVVLVHGAFADGSGWRGVYDNLTARGYRVTIVQNPLTSLEDDVAATTRVLDLQDGPTILVGHSWGGTVITEAEFIRTSPDWSTCRRWRPTRARPPPSSTRDSPRRPTSSSTSSTTDIGFLNHDKFKAGFAADASDADAAFLRDAQVPINMSVFGTPVKNAAWRDKPSWAVIATEDKSFDQAMLQHMATRIGAKSPTSPPATRCS